MQQQRNIFSRFLRSRSCAAAAWDSDTISKFSHNRKWQKFWINHLFSYSIHGKMKLFTQATGAPSSFMKVGKCMRFNFSHKLWCVVVCFEGRVKVPWEVERALGNRTTTGFSNRPLWSSSGFTQGLKGIGAWNEIGEIKLLLAALHIYDTLISVYNPKNIWVCFGSLCESSNCQSLTS